MITLDEIRFPIAALHPWVKKCNTKARWILWRAIRDEFECEKDKRSFIPQGSFEQSNNYDTRIDLTEYLGMAPAAVDQIVGAVFGSNPVIATKDQTVAEWLLDCDGNGTPFLELCETTGEEAASLGVAFLRIEGPSIVVNAASREDEIEAGATKAIADMLRAEDVINWDTDDDGSLKWAVVQQFVHEQSAPGQDRKYFVELSLYDRSSVKRWRIETDEKANPVEKAELVEEAIPNPNHNLGVVPIFPFYGRRVGHMMGDPLIKGAARADRSALCQESYLQMTLYRSASPILKFVTSRKPSTIFTGQVALLEEGEELEYVDVPESSFDARQSQIERLNRYAATSSGMNPKATSDGANTARAQSGIAMRVEFTQTQKKAIEKHARYVARAARQAVQAAEKYLLNTQETTITEVRFKSTFDVQEPREMLSTLGQFGILIDSPTANKELQKATVAKTLGDLTPEKVKVINDEIDAGDGAPTPDVDKNDAA